MSRIASYFNKADRKKLFFDYLKLIGILEIVIFIVVALWSADDKYHLVYTPFPWLKNPCVASFSPLTDKLETVLKLEEAGAAAVVLPSLFEEIISESWKLDRDLSRGADQFYEALSHLPDTGRYSIGREKYLQRLAIIKKAVKIPVLGSLYGITPGGWVDYAKKIQDAFPGFTPEELKTMFPEVF